MRKLTGLLLTLAAGIMLIIPVARAFFAEVSHNPDSVACVQESCDGDPVDAPEHSDSGIGVPSTDFCGPPAAQSFPLLVFSYEVEPIEEHFAFPSGFVFEFDRPPRA